MPLQIIRRLSFPLFAGFGVLFDEILKGKLALPVLGKIPAHTDKYFFLAISFQIIDIVANKPKMNVLNVIVMHFVLNQLPQIDLLSRTTTLNCSYILSVW